MMVGVRKYFLKDELQLFYPIKPCTVKTTRLADGLEYQVIFQLGRLFQFLYAGLYIGGYHQASLLL